MCARAQCPGIQTVTHDVADWSCTREVISNLGHFDLLVNNAGVVGKDAVSGLPTRGTEQVTLWSHLYRWNLLWVCAHKVRH